MRPLNLARELRECPLPHSVEISGVCPLLTFRRSGRSGFLPGATAAHQRRSHCEIATRRILPLGKGRSEYSTPPPAVRCPIAKRLVIWPFRSATASASAGPWYPHRSKRPRVRCTEGSRSETKEWSCLSSVFSKKKAFCLWAPNLRKVKPAAEVAPESLARRSINNASTFFCREIRQSFIERLQICS